jgi:ABC-type branched-subunit amino acid transport system substrate-binding protein
MSMRKSLATVAVALAAAVGLAACGGDDDDNGAAATSTATATATTGASTTASTGAVDPSKPEVHIALDTIKIPGSDLLTPYAEGANAAAAAINAKGGFGGRKVVIDTCNSLLQPAAVTTCAHKLLAKKPVAMVGCDTSWGAAGLPLFAAQGIPSLYCLNTQTDFTDPTAFGVDPGGVGQQVAIARWICTQPQIKTVVDQILDLPQTRAQSKFIKPVIEGCGKKVTFVYLPLTQADFTPTLNEILSHKPDFVVTALLSGPQIVQVFKAFQQAGYPADQMSTSSSGLDLNTILKPAGDAMKGARFPLQTANPGDMTNPDVAPYQAAVKAQGGQFGPLNQNVAVGYTYTMAIYAAAQKIGFDALDGPALTKFLSSDNGTHLPMSRQLVNPGPKDFPQVKQGYAQIVQWDGTNLVTAKEGTEDGWVNGF